MMHPARPRTAAENGFTLVELLISATMMLVILTASLAVTKVVERGQRDVTSRTDQLSQATVGTERLTREIRQASAVLAPVPSSITSGASVTASTLQLTTRVLSGGTLQNTTVTYTCANGIITRTAGGITRTVVRDIAGTDSNVFTVRNTAGVVNYVAFAIRVNARGRTVTLTDGVDIRNV